MSLLHELITLNQAPKIITILKANEEPYAQGITLSIQNLDSSKFVFVGDSTLTTSSYGYRISPGDTFGIQELSWSDELYAICDSGSCQIAVIRITK